MARRLPDGVRLHLQHGPIDLVIGADGLPGARETAFQAAEVRFQTVLTELVAELPILRRAVGEAVSGRVARRMVAATLPHAPRVFVTPMAAVAGAVAEEILDAMRAATPLRRAYVNNGGDIALHLEPDATFSIAVAGVQGQSLGRVHVSGTDPVRGIATSGQPGRSLSMGIADGVTVLAATAAVADAAATLIANEVDLPHHPAIHRLPAQEVQADSDLGARPVVRHVGPLTADEVRLALTRGARTAQDMQQSGLICAAALFLRGQVVTVGPSNPWLVPAEKET